MKETIYRQHGYADRDDYFNDLARGYGVALPIVHALAEILGEDEEFDQLPMTLHDMDGGVAFV